MMSRCASATRRSTRRSTSRAAGAQARTGPDLRTGRALRVPRARSKRQAWAHVTREVLISERPAEVAGPRRSRPLGRRPGDRAETLRDRHAGRAHDPVHDADPPAPRGRLRRHPRTKNGPALAGYGAVTMTNALATTITTLPEQLRRSLTWDRGKELSDHARFTSTPGSRSSSPTRRARGSAARTRTPTACCASTSPKAPTCPDGAPTRSTAVAHTLNTRPRKTLGWKTPAEALDEQLRSLQQPGVATTG